MLLGCIAWLSMYFMHVAADDYNTMTILSLYLILKKPFLFQELRDSRNCHVCRLRNSFRPYEQTEWLEFWDYSKSNRVEKQTDKIAVHYNCAYDYMSYQYTNEIRVETLFKYLMKDRKDNVNFTGILDMIAALRPEHLSLSQNIVAEFGTITFLQLVSILKRHFDESEMRHYFRLFENSRLACLADARLYYDEESFRSVLIPTIEYRLREELSTWNSSVNPSFSDIVVKTLKIICELENLDCPIITAAAVFYLDTFASLIKNYGYRPVDSAVVDLLNMLSTRWPNSILVPKVYDLALSIGYFPNGSLAFYLMLRNNLN
ncbi:hypothetical protein ENBRE01_0513 [Enteropsectra breve]|nr:hypothetical protein ENBRE01_0513 [Enteropsectra breve]